MLPYMTCIELCHLVIFKYENRQIYRNICSEIIYEDNLEIMISVEFLILRIIVGHTLYYMKMTPFISRFRIFGHIGEEADDIIYINWLNMVRAGLLALEFYSPDTSSWRQVSDSSENQSG